MQNQILKSALVVLAFWGFTLSVYFADGYFDLKLMALELILAAMFAVLSLFLSNGYREAIYRKLGKFEVNGLVSALGPVPIHRKLLNSGQKLNKVAYEAAIPDVFSNFDPREAYASEFSDKFPQFVALYDAILRVLTHDSHIGMPATYSVDAVDPDDTTVSKKAHGGKSLLEHSLLVSAVSMRLSERFCAEYKPENRNRAQDSAFRPNPSDPLVGLLGIAHDLGKLVTFRLERENGGAYRATRVMRHHDLYGARSIADLPEFWDSSIPAPDRAIIQNVLAVYHHPHALPILPVDNDGDGKYKYRSDRERALLEQLINADLIASQIENGVKSSEALESLTMLNIDSASEPIKDFKSAFFQFMVGHGLSNKRGKSIGFKAKHEGRSLAVIDQNVFLDAFSKHLGKPYIAERVPGNIVHPVIGNILQFLDGLGVVYRALGEEARAAETCVYETEVFDFEGKCFLTINYAFVIDLGVCPDFAFLLEGADSASGFNFLKCKFGAQGTGKAARMTTEFGVMQEDLFGVESEDKGITVLDLVNQSQAKPAASKKRKAQYETLKLKLNYALDSKAITSHKTYSHGSKTFTIFVGCDQWFADMGYPLDSLTDSDRNALKIAEIKPSESKPGQHVVVLEYSRNVH